MTHRFRAFVPTIMLFVVALSPARGSIHKTGPGTEAAHTAGSRSVGRRLDYRLERAHSFSFLARTETAVQHEDGTPVLISGPAFLVRAVRPGMLRIDEDKRRLPAKPGMPFNVSFTNLVVTDGKALVQGHTRFKQFTKVKGTRYIADANAQNVRDVGGDCLFVRDFTRAFPFKFDCEAQEDGVPVRRYLYTFKDSHGVATRLLLDLDRKTGLPVRYSTFDWDRRGKPRERTRVHYSDWKLDAPLPKSLFALRLPAGCKLVGPEKPAPLYDASWKVGMTPAAFKATDLAGRDVSLDRYAGKVLLLSYWATWCGPCMSRELPQLKALSDAYHDQGLEIVSISMDPPSRRENVDNAIKKYGMSWTQICDGKELDSPLAQAYKVTALPFCIVVGRDGKIAAINVEDQALEAAARNALAK